jgi:hypothetical protein
MVEEYAVTVVPPRSAQQQVAFAQRVLDRYMDLKPAKDRTGPKRSAVAYGGLLAAAQVQAMLDWFEALGHRLPPSGVRAVVAQYSVSGPVTFYFEDKAEAAKLKVVVPFNHLMPTPPFDPAYTVAG